VISIAAVAGDVTAVPSAASLVSDLKDLPPFDTPLMPLISLIGDTLKARWRISRELSLYRSLFAYP